MMKILVFLLVVFFQEVLSQQQQQQQEQQPLHLIGSFKAAQVWDPTAWAVPYVAASQAWTNYMKQAQEASSQLYKQWDKSGVGALFNTAVGFAQQAATQAQEGAETAMNQGAQAAQAAQTIANQAREGAETAMNQGAQAAQAAANRAQEAAQTAANQVQEGAQTAANQVQQLLP